MSDVPQPVEGWHADQEVVRHVHVQSSRYLEAQLAASQALDQRSITFASFMIPTALALLAYFFVDQSDDNSLAWGALASGIVVLIAAVLAVWAARPTDFFFPGTEPWCWWQSEHDDLASSLVEEIEHIQEMINDNDATMRASRARLNDALRAALAAPLVGLIVWYFTS